MKVVFPLLQSCITALFNLQSPSHGNLMVRNGIFEFTVSMDKYSSRYTPYKKEGDGNLIVDKGIFKASYS